MAIEFVLEECNPIKEECHIILKKLKQGTDICLQYNIYMWNTLEWFHLFTKREVWYNKTSCTSAFFIEVSAPSQEGKWSCICNRRIHFASVATIFWLDFWTVPSVIFFVFHFFNGVSNVNAWVTSLQHRKQFFSYIVAARFYWWRKRSPQIKPYIFRKSLSNFTK